MILTPVCCDAIDREEYVPRYLDETDSSSPARPMSVSDRRRPQTTSHVSMRPDQLRDMIGDVVRESLQQAGVGNATEPDRVTPPQFESHQIPRRRHSQSQHQSYHQSHPQYQRPYQYQSQPQSVRERHQYPTGYTDFSQGMSSDTVGTGSSERLHPIYHLPASFQPAKFSGSRDPAVAEEWIEAVENVMGLYTLSEREKVRYAVFLLKGDAKVWWNLAKTSIREGQMTWARFRQLFDAEYRSLEVIYAKAQEFIDLAQGSSSVKEYATRFNALARFVPSLAGTELG